MKNVIFAFCAIGVLLLCTLVSAIAIDRFTDKLLYLIDAGEYKQALDLFNAKREYIGLVVSGDLLRSLHEGLSALAEGDESVLEPTVAACLEIGQREKFSLTSLF